MNKRQGTRVRTGLALPALQSSILKSVASRNSRNDLLVVLLPGFGTFFKTHRNLNYSSYEAIVDLDLDMKAAQQPGAVERTTKALPGDPKIIIGADRTSSVGIMFFSVPKYAWYRRPGY
jgi:hypothetical protein